MGYFTGDIPAAPLILEPARNGEPLDLAVFTIYDVELRDPAGVIVAAVFTVTAELVGIDRLLIGWPTVAVLTIPGLYTVTVTLRNAAGRREKMPPIYLVVEEITGWHSLESARDEWVQAPAGDLLLYGLLYAAREQVIAYAPALTPVAPLLLPVPIPHTYRTAQLMQTRNIMNAGLVSPSGDIGEDSFAIRPYPLDWMIRQMLRPKTGLPVVG